MAGRDTKSVQLFLFVGRIYSILSAIVGVCFIQIEANCQEINAYKTISSGNFNTLSIWQVYNGTSWNPATNLPDQTTDIYIDQTHLLTLSQNEQVKSLFINAETGANQKLNLNGFNLDVFGSLNAFSGAAPGSPSGAWNSQNWIGNSLSSTITFRGLSRVIIPLNSWSGFTTNSRYSVIFDPDSGAELVVEEPFKSLSFLIANGTVRQKLDTSVSPNFCPSFSFNNETLVYGPGPFGTFIIESGGTLVSDCNDDIIFRSSTTSSLLFDLQSGGQVIFEGNAPKMEVANFQLNGTLIYRGSTGSKIFVASTFLDAGIPSQIHTLELQSNNNLTLPASLSFSGDIIKSGAGNFIGTNTHLYANGFSEQHIPELTVQDFTLSKPSSSLISSGDLEVLRNHYMYSGILDLANHNLELNSSGLGGLNYFGGSWKSINQFTYFNTPNLLTSANATFPYEDQTNGGLRKVQLLGSTAGGNLTINFTQYPGAEYNSSFNDNDGTPILYRLFSYFQFSGLNSSTNLLEMRISAHQLIVDDVDDLRIVGTGYAAPGSHLPGLDPTELWARRQISIDDLSGVNFTIGSYRTLSILPIELLTFDAFWQNKNAIISWSFVDSKDLQIELYRSIEDTNNWMNIDQITSESSSQNKFQILDPSASVFKSNYYKLKIMDQDNSVHWSKIIRLGPLNSPESNIKIYPNPYSSGELSIVIPLEYDANTAIIQIIKINGEVIYESNLNQSQMIEKLKSLPAGSYLIRFFNDAEFQLIRWIRR